MSSVTNVDTARLQLREEEPGHGIPDSTSTLQHNPPLPLRRTNGLPDHGRFWDPATNRWKIVKIYRTNPEGRCEQIKMSQNDWDQVVPAIQGIWQNNLRQIIQTATALTGETNTQTVLSQIQNVTFKTVDEKINIKLAGNREANIDAPTTKNSWLPDMRALAQRIDGLDSVMAIANTTTNRTRTPLDIVLEELRNSERVAMSSETMDLCLRWLEETIDDIAIYHVPSDHQDNMLLSHDRIHRAMATTPLASATALGFTQYQNVDMGQLVIPIHLPNHWVIAIVDFNLETIFYYDPTGYPMGTPNYWTDNRAGVDAVNLKDFMKEVYATIFEEEPEENKIIEYHQRAQGEGAEEANRPGIGSHQLIGQTGEIENNACGILCLNAAEQMIRIYQMDPGPLEVQAYESTFGHGRRVDHHQLSTTWVARVRDGTVQPSASSPIEQGIAQSLSPSQHVHGSRDLEENQ